MGALRPGQMLEGTSYQVVREIGAGGMGVVYEIEHVRLKKRYVAKVIHEQIRNDAGAARRMEREAQVLAGISHPNIVQVHDVGTTPDGVSYFVMEKLEGVDLRYSMKKRATPRLRAIDIVTDVLEALAYVHRRGIVHRDIKPENIFLSEHAHGTVTKVLDFGIAHIFDRDGRVSTGRITKTGGFVGTLYYAAPEQMQGKPAGPPTDVYAAGLVLFELLAGRGPFDDDPGVGLSRCFKPAPLLTDVTPRAPRELSDVIAKALEQDPARRPPSGALAAELRAVGVALKSAPGAAEDDALRAEVDDLLRHMAPIDLSPRPAGGRVVTPAAKVGFEATSMPLTPLMADSPRRVTPSNVVPAFEATMASATDGASERADAGLAPADDQAPFVGTMPSVGLTPHPSSPAHSGVVEDGRASSEAPRQQMSTAGPAQVAVAQTGAEPLGQPGRISSPEAHGMSPPAGHPPLLSATLPMPTEVVGGPVARADTSPGVYATVDNQAGKHAPPKRTRLPAIAAAGVIVLAVAGAWLVVRHGAGATERPSGATYAPPASAVSSTTTFDTPSTPVATTASAASATAKGAASTVSSGVLAPTTAPATGTTSTIANARSAAGAVPGTSSASRTSSPAAKPAAASPRAPSTPKGAEKDGYVNTL